MDVKSERPSFLIYKSFYGSIKHLTDENLGKLFRAMFEYHNDRVLKLETEIQMALNFIKNHRNLFRLITSLSFNICAWCKSI